MGDDGGKSPQEATGDVAQALEKHFPGVLKTIIAQYGQSAAAETDIAKKYTPEMAQLQADTLAKQGKELAATGREISDAEQRAAAETEAGIREGAGQRIAAASVKAQREADPEYYASRAALADAIKRTADFDPTKLSKTEEEQVARGLGRTASFVPSALETAKGALTFGDAMNKRRALGADLTSKAASAANILKGPVDAAGIAGQRTIMPNAGVAAYTGVQTPGTAAVQNAASNLMGVSGNAMAINMQKEKSDWEKYMAGLNAVGSTIGTVGKVAGMVACWVAREVYGKDDIRWVMFRSWLLEDAPLWFRAAYLKHGPAWANVVRAVPILKRVLRPMMNLAIRSRVEELRNNVLITY